jgi:hypothetical protein
MLAILVFVAGLLNSPWLQPFAIDRAFFRYTGQALCRGELPYRDFFDHKPPVIHLAYGAVAWAGPWGDWFLFRLLQTAATWVLYRTVSHTQPKFAAFSVCLLWIVLINYPPVVTDGGNTRELCAYFTLFLLCTGFNKTRSMFFIIGLLTGLIFFTQPNEVLPLLPPVVYFLLQPVPDSKNRRQLLQWRTGQLLAGFSIPLLLLCAWLLLTGSFGPFIEQVFLFNSQWYVNRGGIGAMLPHVLHKLRILQTGYLIIAATIIGISMPPPARKTATMLSVMLCLHLLSASLGYNFNHYYTSFVPAIVMLAALAISYRSNSILKSSIAYVIPVLGLLLCAGAYWKTATDAERRNYWLFSRNPEIERRLEKVAGQKGQLFIFNNTQALSYNYNHHISSPSRWLYHHFWRWPHWDANLQRFDAEVLQPLVHYQTRYILYHVSDLRLANPQLVGHWEAWLQTHYLPVVTQVNTAGDTLQLHERRIP